MTFEAKVVRVLIASPGDTGPARRIVRESLEDWNALNAEDSAVMLLPALWERDSTPVMGDRPQAIINRQIVDAADVLIGVFWTRLGTPTGEAESGTVEEIEQAIAADKPVLLYFSDQPVVPSSVDADEYARLLKFKESLGERGLYDSFQTEDELWRKVSTGVTRVMRDKFRLETDTDPRLDRTSSPKASLVARVDRERELSGYSKQGKPQYRTRQRLLIENVGNAAAENLSISFEVADSTEGAEPPLLLNNDGPIGRLVGGAQVEFPILASFGTATQWDVVMTWTEGGGQVQERQTVRG